MVLIRVPFDLLSFLLEGSSNFCLICALGLPVYLVARQAAYGVIRGAASFWICSVAGVILRQIGGENLDSALGCYLLGGWLVGLIYCLPVLAVVLVWRALRPNPRGYCRKCGRAIRIDRNGCPVGHPVAALPRGFEVNL